MGWKLCIQNDEILFLNALFSSQYTCTVNKICGAILAVHLIYIHLYLVFYPAILILETWYSILACNVAFTSNESERESKMFCLIFLVARTM